MTYHVAYDVTRESAVAVCSCGAWRTAARDVVIVKDLAAEHMIGHAVMERSADERNRLSLEAAYIRRDANKILARRSAP